MRSQRLDAAARFFGDLLGELVATVLLLGIGFVAWLVLIRIGVF